MFALGILITIILAGSFAVLAGRALSGFGDIGNYIVCGVFILFGLDMVGALSIPWFGMKKEKVKSKGIMGAFILGLLIGLAAGPCTVVFLAPILAVSFHAAASSPLFGIALILLFGLGHSTVLILAGTSAERAVYYAHWGRDTQTARNVKCVLGTALILTGLYILYKSL